MLAIYWHVTKDTYGVGRTIQQLGIENAKYYEYSNVSPRSYERIADFFRKRRTNAAHFTGVLMLSRPGASVDGYELAVEDGKFKWTDDVLKPDESVDADLTSLKRTHLRDMLASTKNDWRIETETGHYADFAYPFTGTIDVYPGNFFGWYVTYQVRDDYVIHSRRHLGIYVD
jgi:hypothetical protein